MKKTVAIIGLGLIGSSLALALKRNEQITIIGFDRSYQTTDEAYRRAIIDEMATSARMAAELADVVVFATPVNTTVRLLKEAADWQLKPHVIVTDTGSTKVPIMEAAKPLLARGIDFIGGHPMAGSHKSGLDAAKAMLFENAYFVLTPNHAVDEIQALERLKEILLPTKGKFVILTAAEHDRMTAVVSHFPHLIASSLVDQLRDEQQEQPFVAQLAAGGFRDLTRIASADPTMWRDITLQNREELIRQVDLWTDAMQDVKEMLLQADPTVIYDYFDRSKRFRDKLPSTFSGAAQGALYMTFDLHIDVPDHPGVISEITHILAKHAISLTNIRIVETRTDVYGILVISFQSTQDRRKARDVLENETDYSMHII